MGFICDIIMKMIESFYEHYEKIKVEENDRLMKESIKKAYGCVSANVFCAGIMYGFYNLIYLKSQNLFNALITMLAIVITLTFCLSFSKQWLETSLKKDKIKLASNIYLGINVYISLITMIVFYFNNYSEADMGIGLVMCIYWLHHHFILIPGNLKSKLILYLVANIVLFIICNPVLTYAVMMLIGNIIGFSIQLYFLWEKHHEFSQIFNHIENEKNINEYLEKQSPQAVFTLDNKLNLIKSNIKGENMLAFYKFSSFQDFAEELKTDKGESLYCNLLRKKSFQNIPFIKLKKEIKTKQQKEKEKFSVSTSHFFIDNREIQIVIISNITELIDVHEKIISERYQNVVLFSASHEIRSQLNLITGNIERLEKTHDNFAIKIAKSAAKIMELKINLLIDFMHIIMGKFIEHKINFSFRRFVEEISDIVQLYAQVKNNKLFLKFRIKGDFTLCGDYQRLFSIIIHIALNSIKYTTNGFVKLIFKFKNDFLSVVIRDNGIGMKKEICEKLKSKLDSLDSSQVAFDLNYLDDPKENKFLSGIGLVASSMISKKLGGSIGLKSEESKGTKIKIKIQCNKINENFEGIEDESCYLESFRNLKINSISFDKSLDINKDEIKDNNGLSISINSAFISEDKKLSIIIVDDLPFNRITLRKMLESLEFNDIFEAENGKDAVDKAITYYENYFQITIFMDIEMPIMNGFEATTELKKLDKSNKLKIIMLSAFNSEEIINESFKAGAIEFYVKPISIKNLKEMKQNKLLLY